MKLIITKDYRELSAMAVDSVIRQIKQKPTTVLGFATGDTPLGLYKNLIKIYQQGGISFKKVIGFNLDEFVGLGQANKNSYWSYMQKNLYSKIDIQKKNISLLDGQAKNLKQECLNYEKKIKRVKGIDLQILGLGLNGHIGFNEPGSSFNSRTRVVNLSLLTRRANADKFNSLSQPPKKAITMGLATILQAKKIILLAAGKDKAKIISNALKGKITRQVPASILQTHYDLTIFLDQAAAAKL